jgi:dihydrofolate reductase
MNKVILYIATSLDHFIADQYGGVDWLPHPTDPKDLLGLQALIKRISTIIMGSHSYHQILGFGPWAWQDKQTYVFSSKNLTSEQAYIKFVSDDPKVLIEKLRNQKSTGDHWLLGGAELVKSFAKNQLIDECIITIVPVSLGTGIKLELPLDDFSLISEKSCMDGIVQKFYKFGECEID